MLSYVQCGKASKGWTMLGTGKWVDGILLQGLVRFDAQFLVVGELLPFSLLRGGHLTRWTNLVSCELPSCR